MWDLLRIGLRRARLRGIISGTLLCAAAAGQSGPDWFPPLPADTGEQPTIIEHYPEKPSVPPEFTIPVGPLGYSAPGAIFLFHRQSLVSLDFLDENRMLFTFRAPGLMRREGEGDANDKAREIRAVVVTLPDERSRRTPCG